MIPVAGALKYKSLMDQASRRCDLHLYKDQGHGFFNQAKFHETLIETDLFLESLGYLQGKPSLKPNP
ncbi:MAG: hypothetical protein NT172_16745 [Planctomycetota bacterium]|nr:hypothetical protein [Planctomycetota bacterium]